MVKYHLNIIQNTVLGTFLINCKDKYYKEKQVVFIKLVVKIAVVYTVDRLEEILSQEIITISKAGKI